MMQLILPGKMGFLYVSLENYQNVTATEESLLILKTETADIDLSKYLYKVHKSIKTTSNFTLKRCYRNACPNDNCS